MLGRTDSRLRLVALLGIFALIASLLGLRLAYWQIGQSEMLRDLAAAQVLQPGERLFIERGEILDRAGNVLATTAYRDLLAAYPDLMSDEQRQTVPVRLAQILGMTAEQEAGLAARFTADRPYLVVARQLTEAQSAAIRMGLADESLAQLDLEPHPVRFYPNAGGSPNTTLASQLLGFVNQEGQGRYGIEQSSQDVLSGQSGAVASTTGSTTTATEGGSVQLTIDASLQLRLEKELYAAWVADRATRVTGVVVDPYTGAILAWASVPGYNANDYSEVAETSPGQGEPFGSTRGANNTEAQWEDLAVPQVLDDSIGQGTLAPMIVVMASSVAPGSSRRPGCCRSHTRSPSPIAQPAGCSTPTNQASSRCTGRPCSPSLTEFHGP